MAAVFAIIFLIAWAWLLYRIIKMLLPDNRTWSRIAYLALCIIVPIIGIFTVISGLWVWSKRRRARK
jgi:hypothetical protein